MKVTFTPKEFARLLEIVYLGMHMLDSPTEPGKQSSTRYNDLEQKLLDLAEPMGCAELVDVGPDGRAVPGEKLRNDERLGKLMGDYANDIFWHELVSRLSDRDLAAEQAKHAMKGTGGPAIDTDARLREIEDGYWAEFEKNDLANVLLLRGGKG